MADYLLLYSGGKMPDTQEEQAQVVKAWTEWLGALGGAVKDDGNPFTPASKTIRADGSVTEGASASASGYSVIRADSLDEAVTLAKDCPVLAGGASVSVYETFEVM